MKAKATVKSIEALEARVHFGSVMTEVERSNTRFLVSKRGKPKMVMLSINDYMENVLKGDKLLTEIQLKASESGLDKITGEEIETEIIAYRLEKADGKEKKTRKHK